jgi:hypothetical protein
MENQNDEKETDEKILEINIAVDELTAHFRRTSRGRIVELPRWAQ